MAASTTDLASTIGSVGFFPGSFFGCGVGFGILRFVFFGVRFFVVRFLGFTRAFLKDSNVPFIPAWAIDSAFWKSSRIFFTAMTHHAIADSESHYTGDSNFTST